MFHLSDGDFNSPLDMHKHIGEGNYEYLKLLKPIPPFSLITVETEKKYADNLSDFEKDIEILNRITN
jgi:hypothetical protein